MNKLALHFGFGKKTSRSTRTKDTVLQQRESPDHNLHTNRTVVLRRGEVSGEELPISRSISLPAVADSPQTLAVNIQWWPRQKEASMATGVGVVDGVKHPIPIKQWF